LKSKLVTNRWLKQSCFKFRLKDGSANTAVEACIMKVNANVKVIAQ